MYVIVGITSFGKKCGFAVPAVYTNVAYFAGIVRFVLYLNLCVHFYIYIHFRLDWSDCLGVMAQMPTNFANNRNTDGEFACLCSWTFSSLRQTFLQVFVVYFSLYANVTNQNKMRKISKYIPIKWDSKSQFMLILCVHRIPIRPASYCIEKWWWAKLAFESTMC